MPPDIIWWLLTCVTVCTAVIPTRSSCRLHYLANIRETSVLPIGMEGGSVSNIVCHMPSSDESGDQDVVTTEIHGGLEHPHIVVGKRSVNYQVADLTWLREEVRTSECRQTISVEWTQQPETDRGGLTLVSLLNESVRLNYDPDQPVQHLQLTGSLAGVRHILPDEDDYPNSATVSSGSWMCRQAVVPQQQCLIHGKVKIPVGDHSDFRYSFAFRTDRTDQSIFALHTSTPETAHFRLERDFFLRVDADAPIPTGRLSDTNWHTVVIRTGPIVTIDGVPIPIRASILSSSRIETIELTVDGETLLIDRRHTKDDCSRIASELEENGNGVNVAASPLCSGCDCTILDSVFDRLPSSSCTPNDDDSFHLLRDADRLSLFHLRRAFSVSDDGEVNIRTALSFKSDSDAGLLMFGYWLGGQSKGRWQVHYAGNKMTAVYCYSAGDEICYGCSISGQKEIGNEKWHRVVFHGSTHDLNLILDDKVCLLEPIRYGNNVSTAEFYSIPSALGAVGLFIGGTYYEKKATGLYHSDFTQQYFENTREKMPSLRGCVKDVYADGKKVDLVLIYEEQMKKTLIDPENYQAYAIQIGCGSCVPECPSVVRCRSPAFVPGSVTRCDCSDVEQLTTEEGTCSAREASPVPLSTRFVAASPVVIPIATTKAQLAKVWLKFKLPAQVQENIVLAEFNSHREIMLRIYVSPDGFIHVQSHPHDANTFQATVSKKITLDDDRVHMITLTRRTPVGTRHSARKFDLRIDGSRFQIPDNSKAMLNNISFPVVDGFDERNSVVVHDVGLGYDFDESMFVSHVTNRIHQVDVHSLLLASLYREPNTTECGTLDPYLWEDHHDTESDNLKDRSNGGATLLHSVQGGASPHGQVVEYTPDAFQPELLLSSRWLFYSLILCLLLCLLLLICLCLYCCVLRKRGRSRSQASDQEQMMRDSPDYMPVKMRRDSNPFHDDCSIGTDDTDLQAYKDIGSHRVRIYRESMVSILVPSIDQPCEAAIVKRVSDDEPVPTVQSPLSPYSPPTSPVPASPAPLVSVREEEQ